MLLSKCLRGRHCRLHNSNAIHSKKNVEVIYHYLMWWASTDLHCICIYLRAWHADTLHSALNSCHWYVVWAGGCDPLHLWVKAKQHWAAPTTVWVKPSPFHFILLIVYNTWAISFARIVAKLLKVVLFVLLVLFCIILVQNCPTKHYQMLLHHWLLLLLA